MEEALSAEDTTGTSESRHSGRKREGSQSCSLSPVVPDVVVGVAEPGRADPPQVDPVVGDTVAEHDKPLGPIGPSVPSVATGPGRSPDVEWVTNRGREGLRAGGVDVPGNYW